MSLLAELRQRKALLKPTETIITCQNGQRFIQSNNEIKKLNEVCDGFVVDTKPDDVPAKIIEHLYLGSQDCLTVLSKYDINRVLSLGIEPQCEPSKNVHYKFVNMLDLCETKLDEYLPICLEFIIDSVNCHENVLVHCNAGVSRSASIVIAYLIVERKIPFPDAYQLVKLARSCIRPNDGFMSQLQLL